MRMRVLFLDKVHPILKKGLKSLSFICHEDYESEKNDICKKIDKYHGIIIRSRFKLDKDFLKSASNLKFIARAGSGLENIDLDFCKDKQIKCINAPEGNAQAVSEHAIGMLLSLFNNLNNANLEVKKGLWRREENRGVELKGKVFGIIGYGNTGSKIASILSGFGVKILAYDKYKKDFQHESSLSDIFENADVVSLHVPLTKETENLINKHFISQMKRPFYIINTSRGKCINIRDLIQSFESNKILGACLDVLPFENISFESISQESNELRYLMSSRKTILSPHIAGWTHESRRKIADLLLKKITRFHDQL